MKGQIICLLAILVAANQCVSMAAEDFESYSTGTINGQNGWTVADTWGNSPVAFDEEVMDDGTGNQVWRLSNAISSTTYSAQPFSPSTGIVAGETGSSLWNDYGTDHTSPHNPPLFGANADVNRISATIDFKSATGATQDGLSVTLSASAKQSTVRQTYVRLEDNGTDGIDVVFLDTYIDMDNSDGGGIGADQWAGGTIATGLSYTDWHTLKMDVEFVDGLDNSGVDVLGNDVVSIYVDGSLVHTGSTWETYYYGNELTDSPNPRLQAVDSVLFRVSSAPTDPNTVSGGGFFFDNASVAPVPEPGSFLLLTLGGLGMLLFRRRR